MRNFSFQAKQINKTSGYFFKTSSLILVAIVVAIASIILILLNFVDLSSTGVDKSDSKQNFLVSFDDNAVLSFLEATTIIQNRAIFVQDETREKILKDMITSYLSDKDRYSLYLSADQYSLYKKRYSSEDYVGLGMEIEKDKAGNVLCYPYQGSSADIAGIKSGDRLLKLNGKDVQGESLISIMSMATGEVGTNKALVISSANVKDEKEVVVPLSRNTPKTVSLSWYKDIAIIKIHYFSTNTKQELLSVLSMLQEPVIVIDLRGNRGGDFHAAIDSSDLFVPSGKTLAVTIQRNKQNVYTSSKTRKNISQQIIIWQDQNTASAAEVFIAALTENDRAVSLGVRSYGKGERQDIIELSDGSALILTIGFLTTPTGKSYQGLGLRPSYVISDNALDTGNFIKKVYEITRKKNFN